MLEDIYLLNIEVRYPSKFINLPYTSSINIRRRSPLDSNKPASEDSIIGIRVSSIFYESVDQIVSSSQINPGPKFQKSTLNNSEVAYSHGSLVDHYMIPFGNRVFYVFYITSHLSDDEKVLADKMLHSISLITTEEDVKTPRVEACTK